MTVQEHKRVSAPRQEHVQADHALPIQYLDIPKTDGKVESPTPEFHLITRLSQRGQNSAQKGDFGAYYFAIIILTCSDFVIDIF